jgi:hypothetical protein
MDISIIKGIHVTFTDSVEAIQEKGLSENLLIVPTDEGYLIGMAASTPTIASDDGSIWDVGCVESIHGSEWLFKTIEEEYEITLTYGEKKTCSNYIFQN